tara:strand:- start:3178 stop:4056 length:879 start_codon:yes stop_codon:yes gene_type:complete
MSGQIRLTDIEGDLGYEVSTMDHGTPTTKKTIDLPNLIVSGETNFTEVPLEDFVVDFGGNWDIISFPFDLSTVTKIKYTRDNGVDNIQDNPTSHLTMYFYKESTGQYQIKTKVSSSSLSDVDYIESVRPSGYLVDTSRSLDVSDILAGPVLDNKVIIAKDYLGSAYLPAYNFNGIGAINKYEGFQIKCTANFSITFTAKRNHRILNNIIQYGSYVRYGRGWNIFSYPLKNSMPGEQFLEEVVSNLIIAKDYLGSAYLPEWNFNGIGDFYQSEGYQGKFLDGTSHYEFIAENE